MYCRLGHDGPAFSCRTRSEGTNDQKSLVFSSWREPDQRGLVLFNAWQLPWSRASALVISVVRWSRCGAPYRTFASSNTSFDSQRDASAKISGVSVNSPTSAATTTIPTRNTDTPSYPWANCHIHRLLEVFFYWSYDKDGSEHAGMTKNRPWYINFVFWVAKHESAFGE